MLFFNDLSYNKKNKSIYDEKLWMSVNIKDISLVANIRVVPKCSYSYGISLFVKIMTLYYHINIGDILTIIEKILFSKIEDALE